MSSRRRSTICHVLHSLEVGGAEMLARRMAIESSSEFQVVFACLDQIGEMGQQLQEQGHRVYEFHRRPGFDVRCAYRLAGFFRENAVDLVHAHQYGPFLYSSVARLFGPSMPILFTEHGRDYPDYRRKKRVLANRWLLHRRDELVAVGEHVRQALIENEGLPQDRIRVIYNGIDLSSFEGGRLERAGIRQELGLAEDSLMVIQVARLNRLKDHTTGLEAMARVLKESSATHFYIVGEGEKRSAIEDQISDLGIGSHVHLLGMREDVTRLLQGADLFLLTSISEGIPLVLMEAMAASVPAVATDVGGVPEVIVDGENGLLAEAASPETIARALLELLRDEKLRKRMGESGLARVRDLFDQKKMLADYFQLYGEMLQS